MKIKILSGNQKGQVVEMIGVPAQWAIQSGFGEAYTAPTAEKNAPGEAAYWKDVGGKMDDESAAFTAKGKAKSRS
jgi:hypothetical protein